MPDLPGMQNERIYKQSGVVPYFIEQNEINYVLITSMGGNWIFPKGLIEPDMEPWESALQEAEEESGVTGDVVPHKIASYEYEKWGGLCRIDMYLLKVTEIYDTWDEDMYRERKICSFEEARNIIHKRVMGVLIKADREIRKGIE